MRIGINKRVMTACRMIVAAALVMMSSALNAQGLPADSTRSRVVLQTSMGEVEIELFDETPVHRDNMLGLVRSGFYDGVLFHRVIRQFMIQAGDPNSRTAEQGTFLGEGDSGYKLPAEIDGTKLYHVRGAVGMARNADNINPKRESSGSQFYIVVGKRFGSADLQDMRETRCPDMTDEMAEAYRKIGGTPHLDGSYTVFGRVTRGMEVVEKIQEVDTDDFARPVEDVRIVKAWVVETPAK